MKPYFEIRQRVTLFLDERDIGARVQHPLTNVPNRLRSEFWDSLEEDEKKMLREAIKWYQDRT